MEASALFKNRLSDISLNFTVYSELFDNTHSIETLNNFHSFIFGNYQKCLVDALYLEVAKLFDPKGDKDKNLSFSYLISLTNDNNHAELNKDFEELCTLFESSNLKKYRNKLLAHNDLKAIQGIKAAKPEVTTETLEVLLKRCWSLFGKIEYALGITDRAYQTSPHILLPTGTGIDEFITKLQERT
ncbi:AbiU2 domain-containing protein [Shewanella xiamenensis]|uniref:AbiU2 domain-containing protein n=1 Tax=Shewanella xiamenensis TaxID=332186 RepID=UPI0035B95CDA